MLEKKNTIGQKRKYEKRQTWIKSIKKQMNNDMKYKTCFLPTFCYDKKKIPGSGMMGKYGNRNHGSYMKC